MTHILMWIWLVLTSPTVCDIDDRWTNVGTLETRMAEWAARTPLVFMQSAFLNGWYYRPFDLGDIPPWVPGGQCNKPTSPPPIPPGPRVYQVHQWRDPNGYWCLEGSISEDVAVRCEGAIPRCVVIGVYYSKCHDGSG